MCYVFRSLLVGRNKVPVLVTLHCILGILWFVTFWYQFLLWTWTCFSENYIIHCTYQVDLTRHKYTLEWTIKTTYPQDAVICRRAHKSYKRTTSQSSVLFFWFSYLDWLCWIVVWFGFPSPVALVLWNNTLPWYDIPWLLKTESVREYQCIQIFSAFQSKIIFNLQKGKKNRARHFWG